MCQNLNPDLQHPWKYTLKFTVLHCDDMQYDTALAHLMLSNDGKWKSWKLETRVTVNSIPILKLFRLVSCLHLLNRGQLPLLELSSCHNRHWRKLPCKIRHSIASFCPSLDYSLSMLIWISYVLFSEFKSVSRSQTNYIVYCLAESKRHFLGKEF